MFKINDMVVCVDGTFYKHKLTEGKEYRVLAHHNGFVYFVGDDGRENNALESRFEHVKPAPPPRIFHLYENGKLWSKVFHSLEEIKDYLDTKLKERTQAGIIGERKFTVMEVLHTHTLTTKAVGEHTTTAST